MTQLATLPDITPVQAEAHTLLGVAKGLVVHDQQSFDKGGTFLRQLKTLHGQIDVLLDPPIKAAHIAHKAALAAKKLLTDPLKSAEIIAKRKLGDYQAEEQRKAEEERRRREAEARKLEEDRQIAEAVELEEAGDTEAADAVLEEPIVAPVIVAAAPPKTQGVSFSRPWKWRIVDESLKPRRYFVLNGKAIDAAVRSLRGSTKIPGIQAYQGDPVVAARGF